MGHGRERRKVCITTSQQGAVSTRAPVELFKQKPLQQRLRVRPRHVSAPTQAGLRSTEVGA